MNGTAQVVLRSCGGTFAPPDEAGRSRSLVCFAMTENGKARHLSFLLSPARVRTIPVRHVHSLATPLDGFVFERLKKLGIQPANVCSDPVFVRRVFLDVIGTLPLPTKSARSRRQNPNKRSLLIDRLLERGEFADYWAMKWCDLLRSNRSFPSTFGRTRCRCIIIGFTPASRRTCLRPVCACHPNCQWQQFWCAAGQLYRAVQSKDRRPGPGGALTFMGVRTEKWPRNALQNVGVFLAGWLQAHRPWKEEIVFATI